MAEKSLVERLLTDPYTTSALRREAAERIQWLENLHGMGTPWPLHEVLGKLIEATEHLLDHHACDTHGHEEFRTAANRGRELLASALPQPLEPK